MSVALTAARLLTLVCVGGLFFLLAGCAGTPQRDALLENIPTALAVPVELDTAPFFPQEDYQCGPAALATILTASGVSVQPAALKPRIYLPARQGSLQIELQAAARSLGRIAYVIAPRLEALFTEIQAGHPVLVLQNLGTDWYPFWHYAVVVGFDLGAEQVVLRSGRHRRHRESLSLFEHTWQRGDHWGLLVVKPGELSPSMEPQPYLQAVSGFETVAARPMVLRAWRAGVKRWPDFHPLRMALANALYAAGRKRAALDEFLHITASAPGYAPAHNNAAQILYELGQLQAALRHAREAVRLGGAHAATYSETLDTILRAGGAGE